MEVFFIEGEYIQLNQLLKALFWVNTGGEAMLSIADGKVSVNGEITSVKRKKLYTGDVVSFNEQTILLQ